MLKSEPAHWKCLTCSREGVGTTLPVRLPSQCPSCGSERDERHGPQPVSTDTLKRGDYVVAVPAVPTSDPAWDIGLVRSRQGQVVGVWWLLADTTHTEHASCVRKATYEEYEHARFEHGIDR